MKPDVVGDERALAGKGSSESILALSLASDQIDGGASHDASSARGRAAPAQGQTGQQPHDEQAAFVAMTNMPESLAVLGIVEAFIFDMPARLGRGIQTATAYLM